MSDQKSEKNALVPRLRFPEFQGDEPWVSEKIGQFLTESRNPGSNGSIARKVTVKLWGRGVFEKSESTSGSENTQYYRRSAGQFIYSKLDFLNGAFGVIPPSLDGYESTADLPCFDISSRLNPNFLLEYVKRPEFYKNLGGIADGGRKAKRIQSEVFLSFPIVFPRNILEQNRITDCLSSLDVLIAAEAQKLETLKTHKNGLMQHLFPVEGKTTPRLRFSEFQGAGEWEKRKLSSLLRKISNPVDVDLNKMYRQIGIRSHGKGVFHKDPVSGKDIGTKRVFWIEKDALIVNIVFAWEQAVANTTSNEVGMIASHRFPMYKAIGNKSDVIFIKYFFLTKRGKSLLEVASPGGAGRNKTLGQKEFENLEFFVPKQLAEQTKIANSLAAIDCRVELQNRKIDALKAHRRGLMQQLFPVLNEAVE